MMTKSEELYRSVGLRKMPTQDELEDLVFSLIHACELTRRQQLIMEALA